MKRLVRLALFALAAVPAFAQQHAQHPRTTGFAADVQTIPVVSNTPGVGGAQFQTYVAILNPTSAAYPVTATLYDTTGTKHTATINLAANELKTYSNFLDAVFGFVGGGAVTLTAPETPGGTHNNRFIVNAEVSTAGSRFGTTIPTADFPATNSRSFAGGISFDSTSRTNVGCVNQSDVANKVKVTVFDNSGKVTITSFDLNLAANAWSQTAVTSVVTGGYVQFEPAEPAVCYAVVVDNATSDGRFMLATEYAP